jgi:NTP pyrophosphatase (non-canonical NTP hydrolase)
MTIQYYCKQCSDIAISKGFDLKQMPEQLLLIASEVAEALENVAVEYEPEECLIPDFIEEFQEIIKTLEKYRKSESYNKCKFYIYKQNSNLPEELADIVIRVFSFAGGNGIDLQKAIDDKIEKNMTREHLHGKRF